MLPAPRRWRQGDQKLHGGPHSEFQVSLGYTRPRLKILKCCCCLLLLLLNKRQFLQASRRGQALKELIASGQVELQKAPKSRGPEITG